MKKGFVLALAAIVTACSGQISNAGRGGGNFSGVMYPISASEADQVIATSMAIVFPGRDQSRIGSSVIGYAVTIDFALDKHRFSAVALPASAVDDQGRRVSGFAFEVSHDGTMIVQGPPRATSLFERINAAASALREPLRTR